MKRGQPPKKSTWFMEVKSGLKNNFGHFFYKISDIDLFRC